MTRPQHGVQTPTEGATNGSDQHSLAWLQLLWEARSALVLPTVAVCSAVFRVAHHKCAVCVTHAQCVCNLQVFDNLKNHFRIFVEVRSASSTFENRIIWRIDAVE